jgi:hypothetical protein
MGRIRRLHRRVVERLARSFPVAFSVWVWLPCAEDESQSHPVMIAFEIFVNGEKRMTIGGEEYSCLNALVGLIQLPLPEPDDTTITLATSGITADQVRVGMWPSLRLSVGDRVEIRIVEVESVDEPESVSTLEKEDENVDT